MQRQMAVENSLRGEQCVGGCTIWICSPQNTPDCIAPLLIISFPEWLCQYRVATQPLSPDVLYLFFLPFGFDLGFFWMHHSFLIVLEALGGICNSNNVW